MSTDLSKIIQDGLSSTLTSLLGRDSSLNETTQVDIRDLNHFDFLQVNSEFAFEQLTTLFEFFIPAASASIIFNTMMSAEDYDISSTIDDDTSDAMSEFVSNLSGGLVTAFNAENIEDLGSAKFNIQHKEILKGDTITDIENLFRFSLNIEETPILIFVRFHDEFLPFIPNIAQSAPTFYPEEEIEEEPEEINEPEEETETQNDESTEETPAPIEKEQKDDLEEEDNTSQSKFSKLFTKRNKIILVALISLIIILILVLTLFSSEEEIEKEETPKQTTEQMEQENKSEDVKTTEYQTLKKVDFTIKDIDVTRLNNRLSTLTKYQVLSQQELQQQELEEKLRLEKLQKEQELIAFAKQNKEEPIELPKEEEKTQEVAVQQTTPNEVQNNNEKPLEIVEVKESIPEPQMEVTPMEFYYLSTYSIKYNLYKNLILDNNIPNARISICNDKDGRTSIFIGPFETDIAQMKMKTLIEKENASIDTTLLTMTKEEFDQKCNF